MTFDNWTDEELADVWYSTLGVRDSPSGYFAGLLGQAHDALRARQGNGLAVFLDRRFRGFRNVDREEDAIANARVKAESGSEL